MIAFFVSLTAPNEQFLCITFSSQNFRYSHRYFCPYLKICNVRYFIFNLCKLFMEISFTDKTSNVRLFFSFCNVSVVISPFNQPNSIRYFIFNLSKLCIKCRYFFSNIFIFFARFYFSASYSNLWNNVELLRILYSNSATLNLIY